ncbi:12266_t:CDS:1 [Dentiscutata erythropus]|uniref:12266_t:CDS:1 n=1 Tax=Dentiscutata erythropus TaxID=1348616 RepID=A0A9N9A1E5_9GLOM|nr:12266_t:CDS:1 [Dentiscutata erythropus]
MDDPRTKNLYEEEGANFQSKFSKKRKTNREDSVKSKNIQNEISLNDVKLAIESRNPTQIISQIQIPSTFTKKRKRNQFQVSENSYNLENNEHNNDHFEDNHFENNKHNDNHFENNKHNNDHFEDNHFENNEHNDDYFEDNRFENNKHNNEYFKDNRFENNKHNDDHFEDNRNKHSDDHFEDNHFGNNELEFLDNSNRIIENDDEILMSSDDYEDIEDVESIPTNPFQAPKINFNEFIPELNANIDDLL